MINILKLLIIVLPICSFSQSGYLGSKLNVQFNIDASPTPLSKKVKRTSKSRYSHSPYYLNPSYKLSINKVLNDKIQLGLGYKFTGVNLFSTAIKNIEIENIGNQNIIDIQSGQIVNRLKVKHHSFTFSLRKFSEGISPIGKSFGVDIELGTARGDKLEIEYSTENTTLNQSLLKDTYKITNGVNTLNYNQLDYVVNTILLKGYIGRTIPVSKKIAIDLSLSFPLLRLLLFNNSKEFGILLENDDLNFSNKSKVSSAIAYSISKYNGVTFSTGLKYFL
jgi:hypothetical protein